MKEARVEARGLRTGQCVHLQAGHGFSDLPRTPVVPVIRRIDRLQDPPEEFIGVIRIDPTHDKNRDGFINCCE